MQHRTPRPAAPRPLTDLLPPELARRWPEAAGLSIGGIATHSQEIEPGDLFVAIRGTRADGHEYVADAVARGAAAVVVEEDFEGDPGAPVLRASGCRRLLAQLSAAWFGHPARELRLVGITGTMGKTSVLDFLETILRRAGMPVASVGSLGVRADGDTLADTGHTVPGPLVLHRALDELRGRGCEVVLMEATTHALTQERLHGIEFSLGVFTSLVPLEHLEYHDSFRDYAAAKARYFRHLQPGAPLIYWCDDPVLRPLIEAQGARGVACGTGDDATVRMRLEPMDLTGTKLRLTAPGGVPCLPAGESSGALDLRLRLSLLGRSSARNAALAAAAAAALGATAAQIREGAALLRPVARRMQIAQREPFLILDDFGGHPDTVSAVFDIVESLDWRRLHVLSGYRGSRGVRINRAMAGALAAWMRRYRRPALHLTAAAESSDERNRTEPEERAAFEAELRREGIDFSYEERLDRAVRRAMAEVEAGDLLLILGTQGMDGAARLARRIWEER
jgi:UDP-N-acetylmuramoyl-L-alanyl-D-glutamate--2,6-diaminopimelate ligase